MRGKLLLPPNQSGCLKSVPLPRLHTVEGAGARGGPRAICRLRKGPAEWGQEEVRYRRDSLCYPGRKKLQDLERKGHLTYRLPGPGSVAKFPHHLLPVPKTTLEKLSAKHEPLQCLAVQLCFANNTCFCPSNGITVPSVHGGFRGLFQRQWK